MRQGGPHGHHHVARTPRVTDHPPRIRPATAEDAAFLQDMLYEALMWRQDAERLPREWVLAHDQVVIFHQGWGRAGDDGLVAESADGEPIGMVWCRRFTEAVHGEGFVDEDTPELAIAVAAGRRGGGVGAALLAAMAERLRAAGVRRVSLSVDEGNPAHDLYARLGWVDHEPGDGLGRMTLELSPG